MRQPASPPRLRIAGGGVRRPEAAGEGGARAEHGAAGHRSRKGAGDEVPGNAIEAAEAIRVRESARRCRPRRAGAP